MISELVGQTPYKQKRGGNIMTRGKKKSKGKKSMTRGKKKNR